ncbi:MAG: diguanylate cyclase [Magnetococcales bacterium]|nr:diguanylate cyclase [Magnetococcales bacterium]
MVETLPKILVVDDVAANRVAMRSLLAKMDAEILIAASGNEALSLALDHDLAVVLLDIQMPDMDGFEVAEWLRGEERSREVPILFVTAAFKDEFHRLQGYQSGAMDYIEKPVDGRILRSKVSLLLELYNRRQALKQSNQALVERTVLLQTTLENIRHGLGVFDERSRLRIWNDRFFEYPDYPLTLAKPGTALTELLAIHQQRGELSSHAIQQRLTNQAQPQRFDWPLRNGRILDVKSNPMPDGGVVVSFTDVTEQRRDEASVRENASRLAAVNATAHDGIITINHRGQVQEWNPAAEQMFGYTAQEMRGAPLTKIMPERFHQPHAEGITHYLASGQSEWVGKTRERVGLRRNGEEFPVELSLAAWGAADQPCFTAILRDVTERKCQEELLTQLNQRLGDSLVKLQRHHRELLQISRMNDCLQSCLTMEEAIQVMEESLANLFDGMVGMLLLTPVDGGLPEISGCWGMQEEPSFPPAICTVGDQWQHQAARREGCCGFATDEKTPLCYCLPLWGQGQSLGFLHLRELDPAQRDALARTEGLTTTVREAVELSLANLRMREKLRDQAVRDVLTGLFNRRYLDETLPREISRSTRLQQPLAVAMLDVDHFKRFNDTFGHEAGDRVLREVATLLKSRLRKSDLACRYGGEELTVVMPSLDIHAARERMESIRQGIKEISIEHNGVALGQVTISIGVAALPQHGSSGEELLQKADKALYTAKQAGRDRVIVHPE